MNTRDYFPEIKREAELYLPLANLLKLIYETDDAEITDKKREEKHGCDIIVGIQNLFRIGFQVKTTDFTKTTLDKEFKNTVRNAADFRFGGGGPARLAQFIWVTTKKKSSTISESDIEDITRPLGFARKVEIWDSERLYWKFRKYYPQAFTNIKIDALTSDANEQSKKGNGIFAAHYLFRVFVLQLLQVDIASARKVIATAIAAIDQQKNKSIYSYRTLKRFYETWQLVIEMSGFDNLIGKYKKRFIAEYEKQSDEYERTWQECIFLMQLVNDSKVRGQVESRGIDSCLFDYYFVCDFQYIFSQLQILFHEYANSPAGLSSRQICRTLLRFGFPPTGKIAERIDRTKRELEFEKHSVDGQCSLCTGTVLSSLVLANEDRKIIKPVKRWLERLDYCRYAHVREDSYLSDASSTEHALHYAAPVLEAFIDCGDSENADRVLRHFFVPDAKGKDKFPDEWMKHRNISSLEACSYIFPAFHKYLISGNDDLQFDRTQVKRLRRAIVHLVRVLHLGTAPQSKPSRLYATRESIPAFCIGLLIGETSTLDLLREVMRNLHKRAIRIRNSDRFGHSSKRSLMDSNVDRNTRFIEGWASYWETILYLVDDAPRFGADGTKLRKTAKELQVEGYLANYNQN